MILFDMAVEAFFFFIAAVIIIFLIAAAGLVFVILRETAWYVRRQNEKKMEGKDNADGSI